MKSKQRSREFWEKAVDRAEASGKTRAQCAKDLGVGAPALSYWIYKLRAERRGEVKESRALVPVRVMEAQPALSSGLELQVQGMVMRFDEQISIEYVARLAGALRQC